MSAIALAPARPAPVPRRRSCDRAEARETERQLLLRYHLEGDLAAREELVERFLPLARDLALRYSYTDEPFDDLLQVASLGLIKAIDRFEPGRGTKFTSYAAPTILGELKRHFRDKGWSLHVPRDLQERTLAVSRETEALSKKLGRSPKVREVALALDCRVEDVLEAQEAAASYEAASLDAPAARDDDESASLVDLLGQEDAAYDLVEDRHAIASTWQALPDVERKVLELRFMHDLTQREIGEQIGYSQMHVSRLLRRALTRLETAAAAA
ncbi:MAG TPA: SigB/SigF/SigG family RNA polymerase sigma factor [Thermoleophilaceae bacterium]|jgi:RNA polymerase sigma-B factor|nr:SigB/SigF/SigG family RNA polymerase sigma factor [Thermoleophilaceae bacterium]